MCNLPPFVCLCVQSIFMRYYLRSACPTVCIPSSFLLFSRPSLRSLVRSVARPFIRLSVRLSLRLFICPLAAASLKMTAIIQTGRSLRGEVFCLGFLRLARSVYQPSSSQTCGRRASRADGPTDGRSDGQAGERVDKPIRADGAPVRAGRRARAARPAATRDSIFVHFILL